MIEINWKNARTETPEFKITTHPKGSKSYEMPDCLVSDGNEVWEECYDPTEGWNCGSIIRFIELKNIKP